MPRVGFFSVVGSTANEAVAVAAFARLALVMAQAEVAPTLLSSLTELAAVLGGSGQADRINVLLVDATIPMATIRKALAAGQATPGTATALYEITPAGAHRFSYVGVHGDLVLPARTDATAMRIIRWLAKRASPVNIDLASATNDFDDIPSSVGAHVVATAANAAADGTLGTPRVLVVDDDEAVSGLLKAALQRTYDVDVAADGTTALALLAAGRRYDVVFCDVHMPNVSGIEVYQRLLARDPEQAARVVFVTAMAASILEQLAIDTLGRPVVTKPFSLKEILARAEALATIPKEAS